MECINKPAKMVRRHLAGMALLLASFAPGGASAVSLTVTAPVGEITGTRDGDLVTYEGIPYAAPPVGELRWAAPSPVEPFKLPFQANSSGNECVQRAIFWRPGKTASWTEDCLTLNIYAPATGGTDLPVFVGFHGGGSVNGAKTDWDPRELAAAGNIVVTINYRLGALGFLALAELNAESKDGQSSGNFGDLDKLESLRWVKNNIAAFGGNPDRVTISGQSAGARGVCFAVASPEAKGLFQAAVIQSGRDCPSIANAEAVKSGEKFVEAIGCKERQDRLACLRSKTPADILDAQAKSKMAIATVYGGYAQPKRAMDAFKSGEFNRVPMIVGNTRDETRVFIYEANDLVDQPVDLSQYENEVRTRMGEKADAAFAVYAADAKTSPGLALGNLDAEQKYICPTIVALETLSKWTQVHAYEFADVTAPVRSYADVPASFDLGVPHSAELPYVWGEDTVPDGLSADQKKLAAMMRSFWISLASPGGLTGPVSWPTYTADAPQRIVFKAGGQTDVLSDIDYRKTRHCDLFASAAK